MELVLSSIDELIQEAHGTAKLKGWWDENQQRTFGDQIALMHSELSEVLEAYRDGCSLSYAGCEHGYEHCDKGCKPEGIAAEFADALIRIFDTCGRYGIPLAEALQAKIAYNKTRPYLHGGKKL